MENEELKKELSKAKAREIIEQTFLAWIQLGLILVSLGFASVGVMSFIKTQQYKPIVLTFAALIADLFTITGFIAVVFALIQYRGKIKTLGTVYVPSFDLPLFIGAMVSTLGTIAFLAILIDWLW